MNKDIKEKAEYCLNCKTKPCSKNGCPLNNDIPGFIEKIIKNNFNEAYKILRKTTVMPSICGRICPHYKQCMGACIRGIKDTPVKIDELETTIGDWALENNKKNSSEYFIEKFNEDIGCENNRKKIAIIGGGPAGITSAVFLSRKGHNVTIFEKNSYLGGLLVHGIPEFRLPKDIVRKTIENLFIENNIHVKYNFKLDNQKQLKELEKIYDNIILAIGANKSVDLKVTGEQLNGVLGGNELLEYNLHPQYEEKTVLIIGGGNVAMDVARSVKRLGAKKVIVVYRRDRTQMPAEQKEIDDAIKDGVEFLFKHNITKIIGKEIVEKVELIRTKLIQNEGEKRLSPVNIENSNYEINADYVIKAIGSKTEDYVKKLGLELNEKGLIKTSNIGLTSNPKIYAIGDLAGHIKTVAWACKSGKDVTNYI